jgi:hypothetical protein
MRRADLEHVLRAAADVTGENEFVVIGSQAVLGERPDAPAALVRSMEADIYPVADPDKADMIDGALGDGSQFHRSFGYFAHGVGPETVKAPAGWQDRLHRITVPPPVRSTRRPVGLCLEVHDVVLAKCAAGRERDWEFAATALADGLVELDTLVKRAATLPMPAASKRMIVSRLRAQAHRAS